MPSHQIFYSTHLHSRESHVYTDICLTSRSVNSKLSNYEPLRKYTEDTYEFHSLPCNFHSVCATPPSTKISMAPNAPRPAPPPPQARKTPTQTKKPQQPQDKQIDNVIYIFIDFEAATPLSR